MQKRNGTPRLIAKFIGDNADTFVSFQTAFIVAVQPCYLILNADQLVTGCQSVICVHSSVFSLYIFLLEHSLHCPQLLSIICIPARLCF